MIEIRSLGFGYPRRDVLFRALDLRFEPGNVYGLLGANGAGKSTLLKLVTGLLLPSAGAVRTLGRDPARRAPGLLSQIFMLPEDLTLPSVSQREYLQMRAPFYPSFDVERFERHLAELDVPRGRRLTDLSHGQRKKFLLSFGLASGAALLVLDEPTNGLDIPSKGRFRRLIAEAMTEERLVIVSTHQVQDVVSLIDPIVIVHRGSVLFNRTMSEIASCVRMSHAPTKPDTADPRLLYSEPAVGGFRSLWIDETASGGHVDIELLFNAVVARPEVCETLLARQRQAA